MGKEMQIRVDQIATGDEGTGGFFNKLKVWEDHFDKVKKVVDSMQPGRMDTAAATYGKLAKRMDESVGQIYKQATRMVEAWGGDDAEKAMTQMNKTYRQAQEIHNESDTTSKALTTHATAQRQWQNAYGSGSAMDSWVKDAVSWGQRVLATNPATAPAAIGGLIANNWGAEDAMNAINNGTKESNNNFPTGIVQDMPEANPNLWDKEPPGGGGKPPGSPKMPGGGGPPGGGPGGIPGGPGGPPEIPGGPGGPGDPPGGPGGPGIPPGGPGGPGIPPGGPGGPEFPGGGGGPGGTDLASMPGGGPGLGGGGGGLGAGGVGGGPGSLGAGGAGVGPGGMGAGPGGGIAGGPGAFGKGAGKGGMTGMGMPMGAGARGGGGDGNEHERSTWLTEDEDVWGGDDDAAPPVIG